jgi:asparagine synthase (glutamine-hydrolysing)
MCGIYAIFGKHYSRKKSIESAETIQHRGPDNTHYCEVKHGFLGFHRLSVMDPTSAGNQPFYGTRWTLMCNGEIYNANDLRKQYLDVNNVHLSSHSDCEVIWQILEQGIMSFSDLIPKLYGVYAIIAIETSHTGVQRVCLARDRVGVRPLYWSCTTDRLVVASEPCAMLDEKDVVPFEPDTSVEIVIDTNGFIGEPTVVKTCSLCSFQPTTIHNWPEAVQKVRQVIEQVVKIRMMSDRPIACMLSGGVDSSTIASLVAKFSDHQIHTFSIGLEGSTDLRYARLVANHIKSVHHEVLITESEMLAAVPDVIKAIQSYDVTTVRASTPMFLLSKYIRTQTDFKVIFSGEGPDEVCGSYMYFHASPSPQSSDEECHRLVKDMHYFDILRADRSTAYWGLELRVPFLGVDFIQTYWSIDQKLRVPREGVEKWILRKAVEDLLPSEICWRPKEAYSDGVSSQKRSWSIILQEFTEQQITDEQLSEANMLYPFNCPKTKEGYWMRQEFEKYYPGLAYLIPYQWLPRWVGNVTDPSARVLKQYKQQ